MQLSPQELYNKLVYEYEIIGQIGFINFTLKDLAIEVESRDSIGNLIQEWLKAWLNKKDVNFFETKNTQKFPDFYLDLENKETDLLEVKSFDFQRGPGFDLANFNSYGNSLLEHSYRLDSDYLIFAYELKGSILKIKNVWLKKIWEISGPSGPYPIKVQEKKKIIYNLRPIIWYSERSKFKAFNSKEEFLKALNETRYQYAHTRLNNSHWLRLVLQNYYEYTGIELKVE